MSVLLCNSLLIGVIVAPLRVHAGDRVAKLDQPSTFHIAAGSLESALIQFSRQTHIQVVVSAPAANIPVTAVHGRHNAREVLDTLLNATGFTYVVLGETVTIRALNSPAQPPPAKRDRASESAGSQSTGAAKQDSPR